ncbi:MAG: hypothetical protein IPM74_14385 [Crocinitomicaceae bacterium]|nr:hypothetical protein [Crocinitomicaceae bacterium]
MKIICIIILAVGLASCQKGKRVTKVCPEFIGHWKNFSANGGMHSITILTNGRGAVYGLNDYYPQHDNSAVSPWIVQDDILYFGRLGTKKDGHHFNINQYPQIATDSIKLDYDTILPGNYYMILNNLPYRKTY